MKHILTDSLTPYVSKVLTLYLELPKHRCEPPCTINNAPLNSNSVMSLWI